jgi:hypothetical protein
VLPKTSATSGVQQCEVLTLLALLVQKVQILTQDLRKQWRAAVRGTQFTGFTGPKKSTDTDAAAPPPAQRVVVLLLCPSYPFAYAGEERLGVGWPEHMADLCHPQNETHPQVCQTCLTHPHVCQTCLRHMLLSLSYE